MLEASSSKTYTYPIRLHYVYVFGYGVLGLIIGGGIYGALYAVAMMIAQQGIFIYIRAILVGSLLMYIGLNFIFSSLNRFPCKILLNEQGVEAHLFPNRRILVLWKEIETMRNHRIFFRFQVQSKGRSRYLMTKYYVVFFLLRDFSAFVSDFTAHYDKHAHGH